MDNIDLQAVVNRIQEDDAGLTITNAFSINMLDAEIAGQDTFAYSYQFNLVTLSQVKEILGAGGYYRNCIGHADTAAIVGKEIGLPLQMNRETVRIMPHDVVLVAQYTGPRLPEGTTTLPEGASINYWIVW